MPFGEAAVLDLKDVAGADVAMDAGHGLAQLFTPDGEELPGAVGRATAIFDCLVVVLLLCRLAPFLGEHPESAHAPDQPLVFEGGQEPMNLALVWLTVG